MNAPAAPYAAKHLPGMLQLAIAAGGMDAALGLVKHFGGQYIYIPSRAKDTHPLVVAAGRSAADAIISTHGSTHVDIPTMKSLRRPLALALIAAGEMSNNEIAKACGLSVREVRRVREWHRLGIAPGSMPALRRRKIRLVDPRQIDIESYIKR